MNDEQHDLIEIVQQWIQKAENDIRTAKHTLTLKEHCPFEIVCFHAQQCSEKYLKALLVSRQIEFPKTHDLRVLIQLVPSDIKLNLELRRVFSLNRYAIETRYPDSFETITREEAEEAVSIAQEVRKAVRSFLPYKLTRD